MKNVIAVKAVLLASMVCLITACGGGKWVDIPGPLGADCNDKVVEQASGRGNEIAASYCMSQSMQATGKARCDGDRLQIQCE